MHYSKSKIEPALTSFTEKCKVTNNRFYFCNILFFFRQSVLYCCSRISERTMNYKIVDINSYYRKDIFRHFSEDCKCSVSITSKIDVTELNAYSQKTDTKFYINFLYLLSKVLNSREDYRLAWSYETNELICYDKINPEHYIFHEDTEIFSVVYSEYFEDYEKFYKNASEDIEKAKSHRDYGLDSKNHPNWFPASYIPWLSYDSLHLELPDGWLYLAPIINWGKYKNENGRLIMPLTVRLNHAGADGYLISFVFMMLEKEMQNFVQIN